MTNNEDNNEDNNQHIKAEKSSKPGPKPKLLNIEGNWKDAVKKSLKKKRPLKDWPK